jgi:threonine synthase
MDHVIMPVDPPASELKSLAAMASSPTPASCDSPFVRFRSLLYPYRVAMSLGMSDQSYVDLVVDLDSKIAAVGGTGFRTTPCSYDASMNAFVKNETGNVAQSHKARHLFNVMTYLSVLQAVEPSAKDMKSTRRLVVASCGNAGLAAATIAAAANWPIDVCIPTDAAPAVVDKLKSFGECVNVVICPRATETVDTPHGPVRADTEADPTFAVFKNLIADHESIPFSVQGSECGIAIEGMHTLAWEILEQAQKAGQGGASLRFDKMFVQVGGGALGSGLVQGMERAARGDLAHVKVDKAPELVCVQADGNAPLDRAFQEMKKHGKSAVDASKDRETYMFPWANPSSVATGILDDETYDWVALSKGMQDSGGGTLVVVDDVIREANKYIKGTHGVNVCMTGSVGLAGLMTMKEGGQVKEGADPNIIIFSGADRS